MLRVGTNYNEKLYGMIMCSARSDEELGLMIRLFSNRKERNYARFVIKAYNGIMSINHLTNWPNGIEASDILWFIMSIGGNGKELTDKDIELVLEVADLNKLRVISNNKGLKLVGEAISVLMEKVRIDTVIESYYLL